MKTCVCIAASNLIWRRMRSVASSVGGSAVVLLILPSLFSLPSFLSYSIILGNTHLRILIFKKWEINNTLMIFIIFIYLLLRTAGLLINYSIVNINKYETLNKQESTKQNKKEEWNQILRDNKYNNTALLLYQSVEASSLSFLFFIFFLIYCNVNQSQV